MGLLTPNDIKSFRSLYTLQLRYLLSTENNIVQDLNSMIKHASDSQLQQAFQSHLNETQIHVERLRQMIGELDPEVDDKKDAIIIALIGSADNIVSESDAGPLRDAALLATAQKIYHYDI